MRGGSGWGGTHTASLLVTSAIFLSLNTIVLFCVLVYLIDNSHIHFHLLDDNEFEDVNVVRPDDFYQSRDPDSSTNW